MVKCDRGFSLIELLVVISIILFSIGFTVTNFSSYSEGKNLEQDAKKVVDILELAKKESLSSDKSNGCTTPGYDVKSYQVKLTKTIQTSGDQLPSLMLSIVCSDGKNNTSSIIRKSSLSAKTVILSGELASSVKPVTLIEFTSLQNKVYANTLLLTGSEAISVLIQNTLNNQCISVTIYSTGLIEQSKLKKCSE